MEEEKKTTKKKPLDENKVKEAKKKVNELLAGTGLEDKEQPETFAPPIQQEDDFMQIGSNDNATAWLNEQVESLTQQVEKYEKLIQQLRVENQNATNINVAGNVTTSTATETKIIELYKHFESVYTGRNATRQPFDTVKFSNPTYGNGVLDVLLSMFPFLQNVKEYRHRV